MDRQIFILVLGLVMLVKKSQGNRDSILYEDKLLPNLGVSFTALTSFYPAKDILNFNIYIPIPELQTMLQLLMEDKFTGLNAKCDKTISSLEVDDIYTTQNSQTQFDKYVITNAPYWVNSPNLMEGVCRHYMHYHHNYVSTLNRTRIRVVQKLANILPYMPHLTSQYQELMKRVHGDQGRSKRATYIPKYVNTNANFNIYNQCRRIRNRYGKDSMQMLSGCIHRKKRFLGVGAVVSGFVTVANTAMNAYRTFHLKKRLRVLEKDLRMVQELAIDNRRHLQNLYDGLHALASATQSELASIKREINFIHWRINEFMREVGITFDLIANILNDLTKWVQVLQLSADLQANLQLMYQALDELRMLILMELDKLLRVFTMLHRGKIPVELLPAESLQKLLVNINQEISDKFEGYEILSLNAIDYYDLDSILWAIQENDLIINIPVYIREKDQQNLQLMKVESFLVPWDINKINSQEEESFTADYTKILLDYTHIAIGRNIYILVDRKSVV